MSDTRGGPPLPGYPGAAGHDDRPVRADDGRRLLEARADRRAGDLHAQLPPGAVRRRVHGRGRAGGRHRVHRALPVHAGRARLPRGPARDGRQAAVRAGVPRLPRGPAAARGRGRRPRGHGRVPARAAGPGHGLAARGAAARDGAAQPRELPDPRRDQGGPRDARGRRGAGARVRAAPGAGPGRRPDGVAVGVRRRLLRDLERARRAAVRHPRARHARPQLGALVRERAGGVRRLGRRDARQRRVPRRHLRHRRGRRERDRHRQADARARPPAGGHPPRLRRPRLPLEPGPRDARRRGVRGDPDHRVQRPRPRRSSRSRSRAPGSTCGASARSS